MTWTCVFLIRFNHSWNRCIVCLTTFYGFWFMALCLHIVCSHTVLCVGFGSFCKHNEPDTDTHYFQFWMRLYGWRFVSAESTFSHFGDFFCVFSQSSVSRCIMHYTHIFVILNLDWQSVRTNWISRDEMRRVKRNAFWSCQF